MASRARIALVALVLVAPAVGGYLVVRKQNAKEIERVQAQVESLTVERDSIKAIVNANAAIQKQLELQRDAALTDVELLRSTVNRLEQQRGAGQFTVRRIRRTSDLQARLDSTFPEMAASDWGVTSIPFEENDTLGLEYFLIPVWFTETFIIDHLNAEFWREQKDNLLAVDSLRLQVGTLQDSITRLHVLNAAALQTGYDNCYGEFQGLSDRYIAHLRKPTFSLGSTLGLCLGAAGAGVIVGLVAND